jgi:hypothetical protein
MKRLLPLVTAAVSYLALAKSAFADIVITPPAVGYNSLGRFVSAAISLVFIIAAVSVLVMLVWGALQWIFSGGEKDAVAAARNRILNALIGLAILAVAVAIASVFGTFVGINLFQLVVPTPTNPVPIQPPPPATGQ